MSDDSQRDEQSSEDLSDEQLGEVAGGLLKQTKETYYKEDTTLTKEELLKMESTTTTDAKTTDTSTSSKTSSDGMGF